MSGTAYQSRMRRFVLNRTNDKSGTSGTGTVAEGTQYSNGKCTLLWLTPLSSIAVYDNMVTLESIHGHGGSTTVEWIDPPAMP
jgi:hypothetical protein